MKTTLLFLALCSLLLGSKCRKPCQDANNPECENYDPCLGKRETNADFVIETRVGNRYFECDSVGGTDLVRFRALQEDADSFVRVLGSEVIREKSFVRTWFPTYQNGQWLDVQLTVYKKPNTQCYPNDNGIDTTKRKFFSWPHQIDYGSRVPKCMYYPIWGTYEGSFTSYPGLKYFVTMQDTDWVWSDGRPGIVEISTGIPYPSFTSRIPQWRDAGGGMWMKDVSVTALCLKLDDPTAYPTVPRYDGLCMAR